jgi:hypothetical protein
VQEAHQGEQVHAQQGHPHQVALPDGPAQEEERQAEAAATGPRRCVPASLARVPCSPKPALAGCRCCLPQRLFPSHSREPTWRRPLPALCLAARKFLNHPLVLPTLHKIFYEEELSAATVEQLEEAAEAADAAMQDAEQEQQARRAPGATRASQTARRPRPTAAAESSRPRAASGGAGTSSAGASDADASDADASDADSACSNASGDSSANESGDEGGAADDESEDEIIRPQEERMEQAPMVTPKRQGGNVVGGAETSAACWISLSKFQIKVYEDFDDRDPEERERNGTEGQALGKAWGNALNRHSGGNANWFYPHDASEHYHEDVVANGSRKRNCTSAHEAMNKIRRARKRRVFGGGMRKSTTTEHERNGESVRCWDVPLKVADRDSNGDETGTYHTVWYRKRANDPDFKAVQRHEAITRRLEAEKPAPRLLKPRQQEVKAESDAKRDAGRQQMVQSLEEIQRTASA